MSYIGNQITQQSFTGGVDQYNGNNSNTVFGLTRTINTVYDVDVYVENVWQRPTTGYTVSANTITFTSAPPAGSNNVVVVYRNFSATSIVPQQGSVVASSLSANLIPSVISGSALSGITTLAAGNTTITGTLTASANVNLDSGTFFVDGTNNRVGINNTAPTSALTVTGTVALGNTTIAGFANVVSSGTTNVSISSTSGTGKQWDLLSHSDGRFLIRQGTIGYAPMEVDPTSYTVGFNGTSPSLSIQGGIKFPATQVTSADANTLDDYEEGTFTPTLGGSSSNPVYTASLAEGRYTKIGRVVQYSILIIVTGVSSQGTGTIYINGLPFTKGDVNSYATPQIIGYNDVWDTAFPSAFLGTNYLIPQPTGVTQAAASWGSASSSSSNLSTGYLGISGTYITS